MSAEPLEALDALAEALKGDAAAAVEKPEEPWEEQLVRALTWARTRPLEVAAEVRKRLPHFKGKDFNWKAFSGGSAGCVVVTKEGAAACEDALAFLEAQEPLAGLGTSSVEGLALAGEDHVADVGKTGAASHSSSDGASAADRVLRYGGFSSFGECLWYGADETDARRIVLDLIIDDGVSSRGHRKGIYTAKYDCVGVARGPHVTFGTMAAIEFACGWSPEDEAIAARRKSGPVVPAESETQATKKAASTQWKDLGTCPTCREPIKGGRTVEIEKLGAKLHAACFKCSACALQLNGSPFQVHSKTLFCNPCYYERHGEKCAACGLVMQAGVMNCSLGKFHLECIVCSVCEAKIGKAPFGTSTGAIVCKACEAQGGDKCSDKADAPGPLGALARAASPAVSSGRGAPSSGRGAAPGAAPKAAPGSGRSREAPFAGAAGLSSAAPKAPGGPAAKAVAKKAGVAKPKEKPRVSLGKAGASVVGLGMDYGSL